MEQHHLDAEVVAAWADGSLDPHARAAAEAHAADCTRCQAVLAAMVRTEPVTAGPDRGWLGARVRWLVPLATAAAAVAVWVGFSMDVFTPRTSPRVASRVEPAAETADQRAGSTAAPAAPMVAPQRKGEPAPVTPRRAADTRAVPSVAKESRKPEAVAETVVLDELRRDAVAPRPSAVDTPTAAPRQTASTAQPPPAGAQPLPESTAQRAELRAARGATAVVAQSPAVETRYRYAGGPDSATRWRVGPAGLIQRSTDVGKTWLTQASGVTVDLVAVSAPSGEVCWVVGRSGVVLVTADGARWRRVPFPESVDLQAVTATDARTARVTTMDGRVFRTADAGATWQIGGG